MSRFKLTILIICLGILLGISDPAWSLDSLIVNLDEAAVIINPADQNDVRILLKFNPITTIDSNQVVLAAKLRSTVNIVSPPGKSILLQVNPLSTSWNVNTVSWSSPWTDSGGDIYNNLSVLGRISTADSQNVSVDVTRIIKQVVSANIEDYGLILRQMGESKRQLTIRNSTNPNGSEPLVELAIYFKDIN